MSRFADEYYRHRGHPVWRTIDLTYTDVFVTYYPPDPELWLNPGDWAEIGQPAEYMGMPVRTSLGIPPGTARIFDRKTLRYLPVARP
jgi:hypothetical protein